MAAISYEALPQAEKRRVARDLRQTTPGRAIAALLGVSPASVQRWTRDLKVDLGARRRPTEPAETCNCELPASDRRFDAFCRRSATCFYCGRPRTRNKASQAARTAQEAH
jgi:hypothetical protein